MELPVLSRCKQRCPTLQLREQLQAASPNGKETSIVMNYKVILYPLQATILAIFLLWLVAEPIFAAAVCDTAPTVGDWIKCVEHEDFTNLVIGVENITITLEDGVTTDAAISGEHHGTGDITIDASGVTINTQGMNNTGINANHVGTGNANVTVGGSSDIETAGSAARGVQAISGSGNATVTVEGNSEIRTTGGANAVHSQSNSAGTHNASAFVRDSTLSTTSNAAHGVRVDRRRGMGSTLVDIRDSMISTEGKTSFGVYNNNQGTGGNTETFIQGGSTMTNGPTGIALYSITKASDTATGSVLTTLRDHTILTKSSDPRSNSDSRTLGYGVFARSRWGGDVVFDILGGSITTNGELSFGVYPSHEGVGDIMVTTDAMNTITTSGESAHGIYAWNRYETGSITINTSSTITASGVGARGVQAGRVDDDGVPDRLASMDEEGYREHKVIVNGPITSHGEGVFLANGGRVVIGPRGSIRSTKGIAILATGTVQAVEDDMNTMDIDETMSAIPPKLHVNLMLDGRRIADVIDDDWIINDGGETTIAVNNVVLHDGETGVTGNLAANGIWDIIVSPDGLKVTDRTTDPWTFGERSFNTIVDRDFNMHDFGAAPSRCPGGQPGIRPACMAPMTPDTAEPPMQPDQQTPPPVQPPPQMTSPPVVATPPPSASPPEASDIEPLVVEPELMPQPQLPKTDPGYVPRTMPEMLPSIVETMAPRAALYEALPDFTMRMLDVQSSPVHGDGPWVHVTSSTIDHEFDRSTGRSRYDADRISLEAGVQHALTRYLGLRASVHHRRGKADVSAPTRGGELRAKGTGLTLGLNWQNEHAYMLGDASFTEYHIHIDSVTRGRLKSNADAKGYMLHLEAGSKRSWAPRAWLTHRKVSLYNFTDAVGVRVSFGDEKRWDAGVGVRPHFGAFHAVLDLEHSLGNVDTRIVASGKDLTTLGSNTRVRLGIGKSFEIGPLVINAEVAVKEELGTDSNEYSGSFNVRMR